MVMRATEQTYAKNINRRRRLFRNLLFYDHLLSVSHFISTAHLTVLRFYCPLHNCIYL